MKIVLVLLGAALIGGCATVPPPQQQVASASETTSVGPVACNYDQMAKVERAARSLRTQVHWVNCPLLTHSPANAVS